MNNQVGDRPVVWLAGDSSLDNKHWFQPPDKHRSINAGIGRSRPYLAEACNGYERFLRPPVMVQDVAYWCVCGRMNLFALCT